MTATIEADVAARQSGTGQNPLKLKRIHHVELWTGNAKQSAYYYSAPPPTTRPTADPEQDPAERVVICVYEGDLYDCELRLVTKSEMLSPRTAAPR